MSHTYLILCTVFPWCLQPRRKVLVWIRETEPSRAPGRIQGRENRKQTGHGQGHLLIEERIERTAETSKTEKSRYCGTEGAGEKRSHCIEIKPVSEWRKPMNCNSLGANTVEEEVRRARGLVWALRYITCERRLKEHGGQHWL